jgi:hypothetical protein
MIELFYRWGREVGEERRVKEGRGWGLRKGRGGA